MASDVNCLCYIRYYLQAQQESAYNDEDCWNYNGVMQAYGYTPLSEGSYGKSESGQEEKYSHAEIKWQET